MSLPGYLSDLTQTDRERETDKESVCECSYSFTVERLSLFTMSVSLLLLMLLACSCQASHFLGTVMTYYPKETSTNGSVTVVIRYKMNFHSCIYADNWQCFSGNCGIESALALNYVSSESSGDWCQKEGIMTRQVPSNAPFQLWLNSGNWIANINGIVLWRAVTLVELRNRSDTGQANRSPQTTMLPAVRVPSNCQRDFSLLAFDPDGDEVKCRYGSEALFECNPCTPPSVLNLSSPCTLSFSPKSSTIVGAYVVQLVVEDFPRQNITLTQTDGEQTRITTNNTLSKLPVQFALQVDPVVPFCTEGLYLPMFLPPTPANGAQLYTSVNQTLEININAQANISTISELLFSGPYNMNLIGSGAGQFILRWTPSEDKDGESHPICFVVQAVNNSMKYHSELRCVIVSVVNAESSSNATATTDTPTTETPTAETPTTETTTTETPTTETPATLPATTTNTTAAANQIVIALRVRISSLSPLSDDYIRTTVVQQLKNVLWRYGMPSNFILNFLRKY